MKANITIQSEVDMPSGTVLIRQNDIPRFQLPDGRVISPMLTFEHIDEANYPVLTMAELGVAGVEITDMKMNVQQQVSISPSEFIRAAERIIAIGEDHNLSWEMRYDEVFRIANDEDIRRYPHWTSHHDPDTTYEEDTRAFVDHVKALREEALKLAPHYANSP